MWTNPWNASTGMKLILTEMFHEIVCLSRVYILDLWIHIFNEFTFLLSGDLVKIISHDFLRLLGVFVSGILVISI